MILVIVVGFKSGFPKHRNFTTDDFDHFASHVKPLLQTEMCHVMLWRLIFVSTSLEYLHLLMVQKFQTATWDGAKTLSIM